MKTEPKSTGLLPIQFQMNLPLDAMRRTPALFAAALFLFALFLSALFISGSDAGADPANTGELLYAAEGNRLRVIELSDAMTEGVARETVLIERASHDTERGRDVNGMICPLPDGSGRFIAGEDTGQPAVPGGWGIFSRDGVQVGKLTATSYASEYPEPFGCAFGPDGRLFTTELGDPGFGGDNGQLILWFPPEDGFGGASPASYCKLAVGLGTPGAVVVDDDGRVYVSASSDFQILRFSPPFPSGPTAEQGCGERDATDAPLATEVQREVFAGAHWGSRLVTYSGLALSHRNTLYAASVATGRIGEFDLDGNLLRLVLAPKRWWPPFETGTPQGLAVDASGALYYADLDLHRSGWTLTPGPDGKLWRIEIDAVGQPGTPQVLRRGLEFPDGVSVLNGDFAALPPSRENAAPQVEAEPEN